MVLKVIFSHTKVSILLLLLLLWWVFFTLTFKPLSFTLSINVVLSVIKPSLSAPIKFREYINRLGKKKIKHLHLNQNIHVKLLQVLSKRCLKCLRHTKTFVISTNVLIITLKNYFHFLEETGKLENWFSTLLYSSWNCCNIQNNYILEVNGKKIFIF